MSRNTAAIQLQRVQITEDYMSSKWENDVVIDDAFYDLYLNGCFVTQFYCLPQYIKEMTVGYLYLNGQIAEVADILHVSIEDNGNTQALVMNNFIQEPQVINNLMKNNSIMDNKQQIIHQIKVTAQVTPLICREKTLCCKQTLDLAAISHQMANFVAKSELFAQTGACHTAALSDGQNILFAIDDLGRHNAIDKIIGKALTEKISLTDKIILTTGRLAYDLVEQAIVAGVTALVSKAAPTKAGIELAKKYHLSLIGFARKNSLNLYN